VMVNSPVGPGQEPQGDPRIGEAYTRPMGWPNESEQIRTILWQRDMTELINDQTRVLMEIRDILKEEQEALDQASTEIMDEVQNYIGKHRRDEG
jgi:hypothetical protein